MRGRADHNIVTRLDRADKLITAHTTRMKQGDKVEVHHTTEPKQVEMHDHCTKAKLLN